MAAELKRIRWYVAICALLCVVTLVASSIYPTGSASGGGGGSSFFAKPPYFYDGTNYYVAATGYTATRPSATPTWLNGVTPTTVTAGANGDLLSVGPGQYFESATATASSEAVFTCQNITPTATTHNPLCGVWLWDSTNSVIWTFYYFTNTASSTPPSGTAFSLDEWSYSGTGNPADSATIALYNTMNTTGPVQIKLSVTGGTMSLMQSLDGGATYVTYLQTESVGTISKGGYFMWGLNVSAGDGVAMDVLSTVVN